MVGDEALVSALCSGEEKNLTSKRHAISNKKRSTLIHPVITLLLPLLKNQLPSLPL